MLITAMSVVLLKVGVIGLFNAFLLTLFLFTSPNPFKALNWDAEFVMRTLEAVYMMATFVMAAVVWTLHKETRSFYTMCLILLFTIGCTLILVGYITVTERELDYGIGTVGDNMVRKKVPILPILYMLNAYTICWLFKPKIAYSKEGEAYHQRQGQIQSLQNHTGHANRPVGHPAKTVTQNDVERNGSASRQCGTGNALLSAEKVNTDLRG